MKNLLRVLLILCLFGSLCGEGLGIDDDYMYDNGYFGWNMSPDLATSNYNGGDIDDSLRYDENLYDCYYNRNCDDVADNSVPSVLPGFGSSRPRGLYYGMFSIMDIPYIVFPYIYHVCDLIWYTMNKMLVSFAPFIYLLVGLPSEILYGMYNFIFVYPFFTFCIVLLFVFKIVNPFSILFVLCQMLLWPVMHPIRFIKLSVRRGVWLCEFASENGWRTLYLLPSLLWTWLSKKFRSGKEGSTKRTQKLENTDELRDSGNSETYPYSEDHDINKLSLYRNRYDDEHTERDGNDRYKKPYVLDKDIHGDKTKNLDRRDIYKGRREENRYRLVSDSDIDDIDGDGGISSKTSRYSIRQDSPYDKENIFNKNQDVVNSVSDPWDSDKMYGSYDRMEKQSELQDRHSSDIQKSVDGRGTENLHSDQNSQEYLTNGTR